MSSVTRPIRDANCTPNGNSSTGGPHYSRLCRFTSNFKEPLSFLCSNLVLLFTVLLFQFKIIWNPTPSNSKRNLYTAACISVLISTLVIDLSKPLNPRRHGPQSKLLPNMNLELISFELIAKNERGGGERFIFLLFKLNPI